MIVQLAEGEHMEIMMVERKPFGMPSITAKPISICVKQDADGSIHVYPIGDMSHTCVQFYPNQASFKART
jgi:hypothetical protein